MYLFCRNLKSPLKFIDIIIRVTFFTLIVGSMGGSLALAGDVERVGYAENYEKSLLFKQDGDSLVYSLYVYDDLPNSMSSAVWERVRMVYFFTYPKRENIAKLLAKKIPFSINFSEFKEVSYLPAIYNHKNALFMKVPNDYGLTLSVSNFKFNGTFNQSMQDSLLNSLLKTYQSKDAIRSNLLGKLDALRKRVLTGKCSACINVREQK